MQHGFTNRNFTAMTGAGMDLYASSAFEAAAGGVYRSETLGLRWVHAGAPSQDPILAMSASPEHPQNVVCGDLSWPAGSEDGGKTWKPRKGPPVDRITSLLALSDRSVLAGTSGGIFRTLDGVYLDTIWHRGSGFHTPLRTQYDLGSHGAWRAGKRR